MAEDHDASSLYGKDYFEHYRTGFGQIPYERTADWVNFFAILADQIIRSLQPRRVLDAGCAKGFLVEAFWDRGVYCEGIDVSEYAISQARPDIREYCRVGSIAEPIDGHYDVITCIEVMEHLPAEEARAAIRNLCAGADTVLFSSTPTEFDDPTHVNIRPTIGWLALFAEAGFAPDARFDATFLTPHAMLLRKGEPPKEDFLPLYSELQRYRGAVIARAAEIQGLRNELEGLRTRASEAVARLAELECVGAELAVSNSERARLAELVMAAQYEREKEREGWEQERQTWIEERTALAEDLAAGEKSAFEAGEEQHRKLAAMAVERDRLQDRMQERERELAEERGRLESEIHKLARERSEVQATLNAALSSKAWRLAEKCRAPLRKMRRDYPGVYRALRSVARKAMGKTTPPAPAAESASRTGGQAAEGLTEVRRSALDPAYQRWIREQEPGEGDAARQRTAAGMLASRPLFSVIVPIWRPGSKVLEECLQSVIAQTYERWELCIAYAEGEDQQNVRYLRQAARRDGRIRLTELPDNGGISTNSNAALRLAAGDFVALLDHDDTLAPFALLEMAQRLDREPDADVLYSDHDYLDAEQGLRCHPLFKPDWSPEIMLSANYITHLTVLRRSLIEQAGGFKSEMDGAQDWDLFLRVTEKTSRVAHVPKVLYHWRMHAGSTARNDAAKNYAAGAQLRAIQEHMDRTGMDAEPEVRPDGLLHVRWRKPPEGLVSIIIPTKDRLDLLERCITTLLEGTEYRNFEILIVDNASREEATREYFERLKRDRRVRILWHPSRFNYSAVNNQGAREAKGEYLLFLNNDVEISRPEWLGELVCWAAYQPVGVAGARLLRTNGTIQHAGVVLGLGGFADHPFADESALTFGLAGSTGWYRDFLAVTGACMMMRREVFERVAGFDEAFILCGSDVEICLRAHRHGYRVVYNPFAEMIHHEQQTRGGDVPAIDYVESFKHYRTWLEGGDPYWNPNLSNWNRQPALRVSGEESSLAFAERHVEKVKAQIPPAAARGSREEEQMVSWFDCSEEQLRTLQKQTERVVGYREVKRVLWFVPVFENAFYGGIFTILRFAENWRKEHGVENLFAICGGVEAGVMAARIRKVYPYAQDAEVFVLGALKEAADLPAVDVSICTLWTTAYYALHHEREARRFYLIQDFEAAFYRAGSISALVDSTYRMGLFGIANTISLKKMYEGEYGGRAMHFKPCVNEAVFCGGERQAGTNREGPWQVFCYGRPTHGRNAFELVKAAMQQLKSRMGERVRIVSAGSDWNPAEYELRGTIENLGTLAYEDTARLYRESDVGVVMMLTRHPSYIPLEMMASGCLTVTNKSSWTEWLLRDGENCLLTVPTATAMADTVERGLRDWKLRERITERARAEVLSEHLGWDREMSKVYEYLGDPVAYLKVESTGEEREEAPMWAAAGRE